MELHVDLIATNMCKYNTHMYVEILLSMFLYSNCKDKTKTKHTIVILEEAQNSDLPLSKQI